MPTLDFERAKMKKFMPRPKLSEQKRKKHTIQFRVDAAVYDAIVSDAHENL